MRSMVRRVAAASTSRDRVGFCTMATRYPSAVSASYTPCQPEPSTNPPCTSTTLRTELVLMLLLLSGELGETQRLGIGVGRRLTADDWSGDVLAGQDVVEQAGRARPCDQV